MIETITNYFNQNASEYLFFIICGLIGFVGTKLASLKYEKIAKPINKFLNMKLIEIIHVVMFYVIPIVLIVSITISNYDTSPIFLKTLIVIVSFTILVFVRVFDYIIDLFKKILDIKNIQNDDFKRQTESLRMTSEAFEKIYGIVEMQHEQIEKLKEEVNKK